MCQRFVESAMRSRSASVEIRTFSFRDRVDVRNYFEDSCFVAFALWSRPGTAWGRYQDLWDTKRSESIGDILFVPKGVTMIGTADPGPRRYFACHLNPELFSLSWKKLNERAFVESLGMRSQAVKRSLRRLLKEATEPSLSAPIALEATATLLAVDIERHLAGFATPATRKKGGLSPARMRKLDERLRAEGPIPTLQELAYHCGLSTRHLARAFREETGRTIGDHVSSAGREKACILLEATDLPINAIAQEVGFTSSAGFSYAFRKAMGFSPSDLRKKTKAL